MPFPTESQDGRSSADAQNINQGQQQLVIAILTEIIERSPIKAKDFLLQDFLSQFQYSRTRLTQELTAVAGFSAEAAESMALHAAQAVLFGMAIRLQSDDKKTLLLKSSKYFVDWSANELALYTQQRREVLHLQTYPGFLAYILDELMDSSKQYQNHFAPMLEDGRSIIEEEPFFYQDKLRDFVDLCYEFMWPFNAGQFSVYIKTFQASLKEQDLSSLQILVPYIYFLIEIGISKTEIIDLFLNLHDAFYFGHLAKLINQRTKFNRDETSYLQVVNDFVGRVAKQNQEFSTDLDELLATCLLNNQGSILITNMIGLYTQVDSRYIRETGRFQFEYQGQNHSLRDFIENDKDFFGGQLKTLLQVCKAIVRMADDITDLPQDQKEDAPNLFLSSEYTRSAFLAQAELYTLLESFPSAFKYENEDPIFIVSQNLCELILKYEENNEAFQLVLIHYIEQLLSLLFERTFGEGNTTQLDERTAEEFLALGRRLEAVVRGSLTSAKFQARYQKLRGNQRGPAQVAASSSS